MIGGGFAGNDENAGADYRSYTQGDQSDGTQSAAQRMFAVLLFTQNPLERFGCKKTQISTSSSAITLTPCSAARLEKG
jgi:hypothetical protein